MTKFFNRIFNNLILILPLLIIISLSAYYLFITHFTKITPRSDWLCYLQMAQDIRNFRLTNWGIYPNGNAWTVFPPGYPLWIAAMPMIVSVNSALFATGLSFIIAIIFVYLIGLRRNLLTAIFSAIFFAGAMFLCHNDYPWPTMNPDPIRGMWSDIPFLMFLLAAIYFISPYLKGSFAALAVLTRPEGYIALPLLFFFEKTWKKRLIFAGIGFVLLLPYLALMKSETRQWRLTPPGKAIAWVRAPYALSGCTPVNKSWSLANPPKPGSKELIIASGFGPAMECKRLSSVPVRFLYNLKLTTVACWESWLWSFAVLGILGLFLAIRRKDWIALKLFSIIFSTGLLWPFWDFQYRFLAIWLTAFSITAPAPIIYLFSLFSNRQSQPSISQSPHAAFEALPAKQV